MAAKIVVSNVIKVHCFSNTRKLINIAHKTIDIHIITNTLPVTFKVRDVNAVETNERCPQANIRLG